VKIFEQNIKKMKELNQDTLKKALEQLPTYEPATTVWSAIDMQLQISGLKNDLNQYAPPFFIWDSLEKQLELDNSELKIKNLELSTAFNSELNRELNTSIKPLKKQGLLRQLNLRKWAMAATIAGMVFTVFTVLKPKNTEGGDFKYSTETVDNQLIKNDWNDSEADFKMVEDFCQQQITACETPVFKTLKHELDELNTAREDIKNAIGDFNSNADLIMQLRDIEQQRATVLKQIVGVM
jgi:hypothetical protein